MNFNEKLVNLRKSKGLSQGDNEPDMIRMYIHR